VSRRSVEKRKRLKAVKVYNEAGLFGSGRVEVGSDLIRKKGESPKE
jgi:16S rRNA G1207 methylase RsmC